MVAISITVTILVTIVVFVVVAAALRRVVRDEEEIERRVRAPGAHTVTYAVPNGVDPGDLRVAVARGGFTAVLTTTGTNECLLIECEEADRARLRETIEGAHEMAYDGTELDLRPVVFEDER